MMKIEELQFVKKSRGAILFQRESNSAILYDSHLQLRITPALLDAHMIFVLVLVLLMSKKSIWIGFGFAHEQINSNRFWFWFRFWSCYDKVRDRKVECWMKTQLLEYFSLQELKTIKNIFIPLLEINVYLLASRYW